MKAKIPQTKPVDLSNKLKPYENKWVALSTNHKKVLGSGDTLEEAELEAQKTKEKYIFIKLPPYDVSYIPANQ